MARLQDGAAIAHVAGDYEVKAEDAAKRSGGSMPIPLLRKVFRSPRPESGKTVSGIVEIIRGNIGIFSLYEVKDGSLEEMDETLRGQMEENLRRGLSRNHFESLVADFQERADIIYRQSSAQN